MRSPKWLSMLLVIGLMWLPTAKALAADNHQGLWWNPSESGWGINFAHQDDVLFATWFTYGADNKPQWFIILAEKTATHVYAGPVSTVTGPPFNSVPFPANVAVETVVGNATITFSEDGNSATFAYTVNGITRAKPITRQEFASPRPVCVWGAQDDLTRATNYQDLWWASGGAEAGWGINLSHQGKVIFATWFTYDATGKPWWLIVLAEQTGPMAFAGPVSAVTGPPFDAVPFDPNTIVETQVGTATITVIDGNHINFDYTVNGVTQSKAITRQVFAAPGTVCSSLSAPVATAVGAVTGPAANATIGPAGGSLSAPDGKLVVIIPAGALAADTVIGIQPLANTAHGRIGAGYRLAPEAQTFLKPVTLTFTYAEQDLEGTAVEFLGAAFQTAAGYWRWVGDAVVDSTARTVSVTSSHFSDWSRVSGIQIRPPRKTVRVKGSVGLQVKICYPTAIPGSSGDELSSLGGECDTDNDGLTILNVVDQWAVNGVPGGGAVTGTVNGNGLTATYAAPASKPSPNTVAVSARVKRGAAGNTLVVSNITIEEDSWTGTGTSTSKTEDSTTEVTATAVVTWALERMENNVATYRPSGDISIIVKGCLIFTPSNATIDPLGGALFVDYNTTPATYHGTGVTQWPAIATGTCPNPPRPFDTLATGAYFGGSKGSLGVEAQGLVSPDGVTIEGSDVNESGTVKVTFNWKFTRD